MMDQGIQRARTNGRLYVHCGGRMMEREQLVDLPIPDATKTHQPVPHLELVERVQVGLEEYGWTIKEEAFATAKEDNRFFGVMDIVKGAPTDILVGGDTGETAPIPVAEFATCVGIRNSHDKSYAISLCAGSHVFVCDNLAFSAELVVSRKHTANVYKDMDVLMSNAMARLSMTFTSMETRAEAYKQHPISDGDAEAFILRAALDHGIIPQNRLTKVIQEWRMPRYDEFNEMPQNAWRLQQAFTTVMKPDTEAALMEMSTKTAPLYRELDTVTGLLGKIDTILADEEVEIVGG